MIDREQIQQQLVDVGLARVASDIAQLARPCIRLQTTASRDDEITVGTSKFGGLPDAPANFAWPEWDDQPLAFLGQINLAEIAGISINAPLPSSGLLSFFYDAEQSTWGSDPDEKGSWRVYWFAPQTLQRTLSPIPPPDYANYKPCTLSFAAGVSFPSRDSLYIQELHLSDEEDNKYHEFWLAGVVDNYGHQLLGHPNEVQSEMQFECQLAANGVNGNIEGFRSPRALELAPGASQWRLLFQCDSDDHAGWMWGDAGLLYFWITEADLEAQRFDNVWMILQCF
jgi:uncharacterized protein YwqG